MSLQEVGRLFGYDIIIGGRSPVVGERIPLVEAARALS